MKARPWARRLLLGAVLLYIGLLVLAPLGALVTGAFGEGPRAVFRALARGDVLQSFWQTLWIGILTVAVHMTLGTATAWVLVRHPMRGRRFWNALVDLPFAVSPVIAGYVLIRIFGRRGVLAPILQQLDVQVVFAPAGMVLATLFVTLPFMVRELVPVLESIGAEPEQAAATLGAGGWTTFWRVTFPAIRWGFLYGLTLTFARAIGEFGAVLVAGGGIQGKTETATLFIFRALDERMVVPALSAALTLGVLSFALVLGTELLRKRVD